ncbi:four helix bundle protein [Chryseobacterium sp. H1D6B]|uniref:four helix bundle protein n=1 Tax=Chryseobacterium sp. H1D6B TaxID=2940588 RepID=UPI0015C9BAE1|nr:four helix bundle protein [Chryseobacterium sp. H1D6B]MDH6253911.1 four helix bundle protein [Chryseobacterium sp. H1D6B]
MSESIVEKKSFELAVSIVNFYKKFSAENKEYVLSKQILHSGTSVRANIREALNAQSKMDFIHKLSISQKECDETIYWLELLFPTQYISEHEFKALKHQTLEILKMLKSIIITTKSKTHNS